MATGQPKLRRKKRPKKNRKRRLRGFDLHKAMFVLPNAFTVSSIFCGFYAITLCLDTPEPIHLYRAAIAIFFGMFFDMADGRVARLTRTQSEFGMQLDSLADVCSFGVAPAVLIYRWSLHELGLLGLIISFMYVACGALRLARFNVLAIRGVSGASDFVGLPIPLGAGAIVAMVMANYPFDKPVFGGTNGVAAVTASLSLLMVSNVRYRAFKKVRPTKKSVSITVVIVLLFAFFSFELRPAVALAFLFLGYILDGVVEEVVFFRVRRAERVAAKTQAKEKPPAEPEPPLEHASKDPKETAPAQSA